MSVCQDVCVAELHGLSEKSALLLDSIGLARPPSAHFPLLVRSPSLGLSLPFSDIPMMTQLSSARDWLGLEVSFRKLRRSKAARNSGPPGEY